MSESRCSACLICSRVRPDRGLAFACAGADNENAVTSRKVAVRIFMQRKYYGVNLVSTASTPVARGSAMTLKLGAGSVVSAGVSVVTAGRPRRYHDGV